MLRIGAHTIVEEGEILKMRLCGTISLAEMQQITAAIDGVIARHGRFGVIAEAQELNTVEMDARRFAGRWANVAYGYGTAVLGANLVVRTLLSLLSRAILLFRGNRSATTLHFCKTEAEALEWLSKQRETWKQPV